jgi:large subunit ribosomal protein L13
MKTYSKTAREVNHKWYCVDAGGVVLGRLAAKVARILQGKHKPTFTPHIEDGDIVVVLNAAKIKTTGRKLDDKLYFRYSGYPGGAKLTPLGKMLQKKPQEVIRLAVWGMLPHTKLGRRMLSKLKVYAGPEHPHAAQRPEPLTL